MWHQLTAVSSLYRCRAADVGAAEVADVDIVFSVK